MSVVKRSGVYFLWKKRSKHRALYSINCSSTVCFTSFVIVIVIVIVMFALF